jgi:hypothetical protein
MNTDHECRPILAGSGHLSKSTARWHWSGTKFVQKVGHAVTQNCGQDLGHIGAAATPIVAVVQLWSNPGLQRARALAKAVSASVPPFTGNLGTLMSLTRADEETACCSLLTRLTSGVVQGASG